VHTDAHGRASATVVIHRPGVKRATARKRGYRPGHAEIVAARH
jgi:hypothetical protein